NEVESEDGEGPVDDVDEDKAEYNHLTVKTSVAAAFSDIEKMFGISISESDQQMAQQLLPKISGLANHVKNSPLVQQKFEQYVATTMGPNHSPHPSLPCAVPTRWNTELISIRGHVKKHIAVKQLTADRDLSLRSYQLTDTQLELAQQLAYELRAFERLILLFSETQIPLIHQVIPALLKLRDYLQSTMKSLPPALHLLLRVAACASLKKPLADNWLWDDEIDFDTSPKYQDTIQEYLSTPLVLVETLRQSGLLVYWNDQQ
ncbi:hypothetical protein FRC11_006185, partial [Ceratobasidium sp. 423]